MKQKLLRSAAAILFIGGLFVFSACSNNDYPAGPSPDDLVEEQLQKMTLREKVGQMFYGLPEECLLLRHHHRGPHQPERPPHSEAEGEILNHLKSCDRA